MRRTISCPSQRLTPGVLLPCLCLGLIWWLPAPLFSAEPPKSMNALVAGKLYEGINSVTASSGGQVVLIYPNGVARVSVADLSDRFLERWNFSPEQIEDLRRQAAGQPGLAQPPPPGKNGGIHVPYVPEVESNEAPDRPFDPWEEIWSEFPKVSLRDLLRRPRDTSGQIVQIEGEFHDPTQQAEGPRFVLHEGNLRVTVHLGVWQEAASKLPRFSQRLKVLMEHPTTGAPLIRLVGQLELQEGGAPPQFIMADYRWVADSPKK